MVKDLASRLGVTDDTIINWEIRNTFPRMRKVREKLASAVPGVGRFLRMQNKPLAG